MTPRPRSEHPSRDDVLSELLNLATASKAARTLGMLASIKQAASDPSRCVLQLVGGGEINEVFRVHLPPAAPVKPSPAGASAQPSSPESPSLLFKWHPNPPAGFFQAEQEGLAALEAAGALRVPRVLAASRHGLLMEWLERRAPGRSGSAGRAQTSAETDAGAALGRGLAALHRTTAPAFGFAHDNFVGLLPQKNGWEKSWISFYRTRRLEPQLQIAEQKGLLTRERRQLAERLLERLPRWIDDRAVQPALLHGDLWHGNWLDTVDGPALIDPAVYYGDREMDLAMAALFGGFPESFWRAYEEAYPLLPGYEERRPLYQLYYLLIHLNIFGEAYGPAVDRILLRYGR